MPVRQQYFIASAIIALIGVMVIFAIFDYFNDRSRFAERKAAQSQGALAVVQTPYPMSVNLPGLGNSFSQDASWSWSHPQAPRLPRPRGVLYCSVCDFVMSTKHQAVPNSIRCPRCSAFLYFSGPETGGIAGTGSTGLHLGSAWQQAGGVLDARKGTDPSLLVPRSAWVSPLFAPALQGAVDGFGG